MLTIALTCTKPETILQLIWGKKMPSFTVKNIPEDLYGKLKLSAKHHRRSINSELIACLENVLVPKKFDLEDYLANAQRIRRSFSNFNVSDEDLQAAKNSGRQ